MPANRPLNRPVSSGVSRTPAGPPYRPVGQMRSAWPAATSCSDLGELAEVAGGRYCYCLAAAGVLAGRRVPLSGYLAVEVASHRLANNDGNLGLVSSGVVGTRSQGG